MLKEDIQRQLEGGNVVLLSNLGFTAAGEVLNCNTYDVGLHAAVELGADKLFFLHLDEVTDLQLPHWLPLSEAQNMLIKRLQDSLSSEQMDVLKASMDTYTNPIASVPPWQQWGVPVSQQGAWSQGPGFQPAAGAAGMVGAGPVAEGGVAFSSGGAVSAGAPGASSPYPTSPRELPQQVAKATVSRAANRCGPAVYHES